MRTRVFLILTFLLGNIFVCQGVAQNENQTNQNEVAAKNIPLKLRLNNEEMGTTENTSVLSNKLKAVFNNRSEEGVLKEGTNEVDTTVYLEGDRSVSAEEIAKLFGVLNSLSASPILIPVKVPVKKRTAPPRPNPLTLLVYAGSGESRFANAGIEIGFMGELLENRLSVPSVKGEIAVVADRNGTYTMEGKQISASDLKIEIEKRLKIKEKDKKVIIVKAANFGSFEDVASIAASASAVKVYFITRNIEHKENGISFSLSPAYFKDKDHEQIPEFQSVRFSGPDFLSFEITLSDELFDKERAESEIRNDHEHRKKSFKEAEVSLTEIDGSLGVLTIQNDVERYNALWIGFREKNGKQQLVRIVFACPTKESSYSHYEFLQIIKSVKFNQ